MLRVQDGLTTKWLIISYTVGSHLGGGMMTCETSQKTPILKTGGESREQGKELREVEGRPQCLLKRVIKS